MTRARTDANHAPIMRALRAAGVSVVDTSMVGGGFADLVTGYRGSTRLLEVKDGAKPPSARKLTSRQSELRETWRGEPIYTVTSIDEALHVVCGVPLK